MNQDRSKSDWRPVYAFSKRSFDILVSAFGLLLVAPLMASLAIMVKLSSPGPVFFRGERGSKGGGTFRIFKFRSMVVGSENGAGTTSRHDARVTRIGRVMREHKLDELPQLINVLMGDMSIVGPRPELPRYTRNYTGQEKIILSVRPGITDLASIRFRDLSKMIGDADPDEAYEAAILRQKNALRIDYVRRRSFSLDMLIIWRTVRSIVRI